MPKIDEANAIDWAKIRILAFHWFLLMKAMDTISQGKTASSTDMMVAQNTLQDINTAFKEPELANQLKPILTKANQLQQKK